MSSFPINIRPDIAELEESKIVEVWRMGFDHPDTIGMWVGQGDLPTPRFICDATSQALAEGHTYYTHKRGIPELRQALADYHRDLYGVEIADARIAVTSAGMNAMMLIVQTLLSVGDNIVCVTPVWPNIFACAQIQGGVARHVPLVGTPHGWELDIETLFAACDSRTRAIYVASPGNPTGWVMPEAQRRATLDFCRNHGIALIADEVYHRLVYNAKVAPSFLEIARPDDPLFVVNSFSKTWAMTGWRVGWMILPQGLTDQIDRLIEFNTSGGQSFLQAGCVAAIRQGEPWVKWMVERCRQGRDLVMQRIAGMNRISVIPADASFYLMLKVEEMGDPVEFCKRLVQEAGIGLAPGTAFGAGGEQYLRLCYAQSNERLNIAMDRLQGFLGKS